MILLRGLAIVGAVLLVTVAAFLLYALLRPSTLHIEKQTTIAAPAAAVYAHLVDLHKWPAWWENERMDGPRTLRYSGPERGVGAEVEVTGKRLHRFAITAADEPREVAVHVTGPPEIDYQLRFVIAPSSDGCEVTLHFDTHLAYWEKLIDAGTRGLGPILGEGYERCLRSLRDVCESGTSPR